LAEGVFGHSQDALAELLVPACHGPMIVRVRRACSRLAAPVPAVVAVAAQARFAIGKVIVVPITATCAVAETLRSGAATPAMAGGRS
jgi:hypothetical protein